MTDSWTITKILNWCADYFKSKGIDSARLDAELLLAHVLKLTRMQLYLNFDRPLGASELASFKEFVKRRAQREPVAYMTGEKEFWSRAFHVEKGVLVPRPDTEVLIEAVLERLKGRDGELAGFELGTGSGCVAVTLLAEIPALKMTAVEISETAGRVTLANAERHGVAERLCLIHEDFTQSIPFSPREKVPTGRMRGSFDFIVSNPPYIAENEFPTLPPDVRDFEPREALDGGKDGLDFYRLLATFSQHALQPEGFIAVEIGETQGAAVSEIFRNAGLAQTAVKKDYAGLDRVVAASR